MAKEPQVLETLPSNYAIGVPTSTSITVDFNIDLDTRYIDDYVYLTDSRGVHIETRVTYRKKRITVTPIVPLEAGKTYQLVLVGDSNLEDGQVTGLRSILGDPFPGTMTLTFTTDGTPALEPPTLLSPAYGSVNRQDPVFSWNAVENAEWYEFRLSRSNRFDVIEFPVDPEEKFHTTSLEPDIAWEEGIYYWSVRGVRADGTKGEWSEIGQFSISLAEPGPIAPGDVPPTDILYEEQPFDLELAEVFPQDGTAGVPLNLKSIYFRVIGDVDVSLIDANSFRMVGTHISGDYDAESHGEVTGQVTLIKANDGTTYIVFTPDVLTPPTPAGP